MKVAPLWQISITTSREGEEATAALLERVYGRPASLYLPEDQDLCRATVYETGRSADVRSKRRELQAGLEFLLACGLKLGEPSITIQGVPREDWRTSWRKHFKTLEFGRALLIRPSWSKKAPRKGQALVTLDPGLSFGTGQHATTAFCLRQLVKASKSGQIQSFLDIGTGSGILAIAAVKLGFNPVKAFDNDPAAVRIAKANARRNRVADRLEIVRRDLMQLVDAPKATFDFICANLVPDLLIAHADRLVGQLHCEGSLVLAGILTGQFVAVERSYAERGLYLQTVDVEGEWKSGRFSRRA